MDEKRTPVLGRSEESISDPDAASEAALRSGKAAAKQREPGGMEETAAAVALAIDRGRRASPSMALALGIAAAAGPDEWAMSGRLAQVNRFPARDPWNR